MTLRSVASVAVLVGTLAACGSEPTTSTPAPTPQTTVATTSAAPHSVPASRTSATNPISVALSSGEVEYLTRQPNGTYKCWQGATTVHFSVSNESGKAVTTTVNGTTFEVKRSDSSFWISYQNLPTPLVALIVNEK